VSKNNSVKGQAQRRKVPLRTCIGCRETDSKRGLIRIVRSPTGVQVDPTGKQAGRGAYMHAQRACWESALQGQQVARALRMEIGPQDWQRLQAHAATLPDAERDKVNQ
jgi:predicted RNA-binding protein YlxR (DUF448 family)|tara:strand:+ start:270 stop:593 length:324 start_codon:yes stop_codon:yes gene_type:complete